MPIRYSLVAVLAAALVTARAHGQAQVTYVDATSLNTVGVLSNMANWFDGNDQTNTTGTVTMRNDLWRYRNNQGFSATGVPNRGIWEATSSSSAGAQEDAPELKTTVTDIPNGLYDIYVFYNSFAGENNKIRAGFTSNPNMNPVYDKTGEAGIAGKLAFEGIDQLSFTNISSISDDTEKTYYAIIGQKQITDGILEVFIDDFPASTTGLLSDRTWYSGIGYAAPAPILEINSTMNGLASAAATWSNNQPPSAANNYNVLSGHTVTIDQSFPGRVMRVKNGGTASFSNSNLDIKFLIIEPGANLTETVSGTFILGMPTFQTEPLGILELQEDVAFDVDAGSEFIVGLKVEGSGDITFNTGAGSTVRLADSEASTGVINFNGSGDLFTLEWNRDFHHVVMNSTGANKFAFLQSGGVAMGTLVYNQSGIMAHETTVAGSRLIAIDRLEVNAPLTVEVKADYTDGANSERRMQISEDLVGSADILVVGSDIDPTSIPASVGMHEFELGSQSEPSGAIAVETYSGTITASKFVNMELRHSLPAARIVVGDGNPQKPRFEMGHDVLDTTKKIAFGEIVVKSGATMEIGFEDPSGSSTVHAVGHLLVTSSGGRSGDLTLESGSKMSIQVNDTEATDFDTVTVEGNLTLTGSILEVWYKPEKSVTDPTPSDWTPQVNDEFVIMSVVPSSSLSADFNGSNSVDGVDLGVWRAAFGSGPGADADNDGDSDGADFLAWQREFGLSAAAGSIIGNFADVVAPASAPWPPGLDFTTVVSGNNVILRVTSAPSPVAPVPEPSAVALALAGVAALAAQRRRKTR